MNDAYLGCTSTDPKIEVFSRTNKLADFDLAKFQNAKWLSSIVNSANDRQIWFCLRQIDSNFLWWNQKVEQTQTIVYMCLGKPQSEDELLDAMVELIHSFFFGDTIITNYVRSPLYFFAVPNEVDFDYITPPAKPSFWKKIRGKIKINLV